MTLIKAKELKPGMKFLYGRLPIVWNIDSILRESKSSVEVYIKPYLRLDQKKINPSHRLLLKFVKKTSMFIFDTAPGGLIY